tara:strand:- start:1086 stop:1427 length:342 start_codon:yes stop_codon:yes gene_type:complete
MKVQLVLGFAAMLAFASCQDNTSVKVKEPITSTKVSKENLQDRVSSLSKMIEKALTVEVDNTLRATKIVMFIKRSKLDKATAKKVATKIVTKSKLGLEEQKEIFYILNKELPD